MGTAVFKGKVGPTPGKFDDHRDRDVVEVDEPGFRRKRATPSGVHREARICMTGIVGAG